VNWAENNWKKVSFEKSTEVELHVFLTKKAIRVHADMKKYIIIYLGV